MWEWEKDPEFASLSPEEKRRIRANYFFEQMADDEFYALPEEEQKRVLGTYLGQFETAGPRHAQKPPFPVVPEEGVEQPPKPELTFQRAKGALWEGIKDVARETAEAPAMFAEAEERHPIAAKILKTVPIVGMGARALSRTGQLIKPFRPIIEERLATAPEYEGVSSGFVEDVLRTAPQFASAMGTGLLGGALLRKGAERLAAKAGQELAKESAWKAFEEGAKIAAGGQMFAQIAGGTYEDLRKQGVDEDRAFVASLLNASWQTPLEFIGFDRIFKAWKPGRPLSQKINDFLVAMGTEGLEEFVQQYPDEFAKTWAKQADKSTVKAINEFIQKLPETTKEALYSGLVALPLAAAGAGVGTLASSTAPTPTVDPDYIRNLNELLKYRVQLVDEARRSLQEGKTIDGKPFTPDDLFRLRHDPIIKRLGIVDQLNDLIIEHWASQLDLGPGAEPIASVRSGGVGITEPAPLQLGPPLPLGETERAGTRQRPIRSGAELMPDEEQVGFPPARAATGPLGYTQPAGTVERPIRSGAESPTASTFANKLLAYRRRAELAAQGIDSDVVPVQGGYAVVRKPSPTLEERRQTVSRRLGELLSLLAERARPRLEVQPPVEEPPPRPAPEVAVPRPTAVAPLPPEPVPRPLPPPSTEALPPLAPIQEPEGPITGPRPQPPTEVVAPVPPQTDISEPPATEVRAEEEETAPVQQEVFTEIPPGAKGFWVRIQSQELGSKPVVVQAEEAKIIKSPPGFENYTFVIHAETPPLNLRRWVISEATSGVALTNPLMSKRKAIEQLQRSLKQIGPEQFGARLREAMEADRLTPLNQPIVAEVTRKKTKGKGPRTLEATAPEQAEREAVSETSKPVEAAGEAERKAPVIEAFGGVTPEELIEEFKRQAAEQEKKTKIERELEIRSQMSKKKAEAKRHLVEIRKLAREISDIIGGERGSISDVEIDPEKWPLVKEKLWLMYDHAVKAGLAMKEFVGLAVRLLGTKGLPYFEKFAREELPKGRPVEEAEEEAEVEATAEEEERLEEVEAPEEEELGPQEEEGLVVVDVGRQRREEEEEEEEEREEGEESEAMKAARQRFKKLIDAGEKMEGKRSSKDPRERIEVIREKLSRSQDKTDIADYLAWLNTMLNKTRIFNPELAPNATPGLKRYINGLRASFKSFSRALPDWVWPRRSPTAAKLKLSYMDRLIHEDLRKEIINQANDTASQYLALSELLAEALSGAQSLADADKKLALAIVKNPGVDNIKPDGLPYTTRELFSLKDRRDRLNSFGLALVETTFAPNVEAYAISQRMYEEEHIELESKDIPARTSHPLAEIKTPDTYRKGANVTPDDLINTFRLRGVEFGEWTDNLHKQLSVNLTYDSFAMLAELTGLPKEAIGGLVHPSLQGQKSLGIAFGSRGRGKPAAHYEPGFHVINLTKTRGDGTLAHEWAHALFQVLEKVKLKESKYPELLHTSPLDDFIDAIQYDDDISNAIEKAMEILRGGWQIAKLSERLEQARFTIHKAVQGSRVPRQFFVNAKKLDEKRGKKYWSEKTELFARAFQAWVADRLAGENHYLNDKAYVNYIFPRAFPQDDERVLFNDYFDKFFKALKWDQETGSFTFSPDYVPPAIEKRNAIRKLVETLDDRLEEIANALFRGKPSALGLYWYAYRSAHRGPYLQPEGYDAYNDELKVEVEGQEISGIGVIGYNRPLTANEVIEYNLIAVEVKDESNIVVVKEVKDGSLDDRTKLTSTPVEGEIPSTGKRAGKGGGTEGVRGGDVGEGGRDVGGPGVPPGGTSGVRGGAGTGRVGQLFPGVTKEEVIKIDYNIKPDDIPIKLSLAERFNNNLAALHALKQIEAENRLATPEEQSVLAKFTGWGGMGPYLELRPQPQYQAKANALQSLLTSEERGTAASASDTAYYTPLSVLSAMWDAIQHFGFTGGRVLEPSVGTGFFFGTMPHYLRKNSLLVGVEIDPITSRIAQQLYQNSTIINSPFEEAALPEAYFDLVVGNVPFLNEVIYGDRHTDGTSMRVHDYFIAKGLDLLKPGGLMAVLTSRGTLDASRAMSMRGRGILAKKAELVGAIRLPNGIFWGAEAGADLLIFRKKGGLNLPALPELKWQESKSVEGKPYEHRVNEYFIDHPEHIIGERDPNRLDRWDNVIITADLDRVEDLLRSALLKLPGAILAQQKNAIDAQAIIDKLNQPVASVSNTYLLKDGKIYYNEDGKLVEISLPEKQIKRLKGHIAIRDSLLKLLAAEADPAEEARFAGIGLTQKAHVGKQFQFQSQAALENGKLRHAKSLTNVTKPLQRSSGRLTRVKTSRYSPRTTLRTAC